jgi:hypothetical protein
LDLPNGIPSHDTDKDTFTLARKDHFWSVEYQFHETIEKGHGRIEIRKHWLIDDLEHLSGSSRKAEGVT